MPAEQAIRTAIDELHAERAKLDKQIETLKSLLNEHHKEAPPRGKRMNAQARAAISKRMKAYWAKRKKSGKASGIKEKAE